MSNQPVWKLVANLGDVNPLEYGGYFVYVDETGVYPAEAELLVEPSDDELADTGNAAKYLVYRWTLERCTFTNGVLSDNKFYPDHPAWFASHETNPRRQNQLIGLSDSISMETQELIKLLCSENPIDLAQAYRAIGEYHGFENLDSYPLTLTRAEAVERYSKEVSK